MHAQVLKFISCFGVVDKHDVFTSVFTYDDVFPSRMHEDWYAIGVTVSE